jgi:hypothetical protein
LWEQVFSRLEIENDVRKRTPNDLNSTFSRKGNGGRRRKIPTRWPMEGKGETPFHIFPLSPNKFYLNFQFFFL